MDAREFRRTYEEMERLENELLRRTSQAESMAQLEQLCREFAPHLRSWEAEAIAEDYEHLSILQERLRRAADWRKERLGEAL
ncbi:MAG: hypothetical protein AMXMBFR33_32070 [Candidatus Xenobia bacterium]|jgi:hypothetical protein